MEIYTRIIDNNLCIAHFSLEHKEAMHIYQEVEKNHYGAQIDLEESFLKAIEEEFLNDKLLERDLICIGKKDIRILSDIKKDQPFVCVARFLVLPQVVNLSLPLSLPLTVKEEYNKKVKNLEKDLVNTLLENGYSSLKKCDEIDKDCMVTYDLRFSIDGNVISEYPNQILEMYKDNELELEKFIGAKVNDTVIVSDVDGVITDFLIKKIQKNTPYNQNTKIEKFQELGYQSYQEMFELFSKSYYFITKVNLYIDYMVNFIYQNSDLNFNDQILEFYKSRDFFAYDKEYDFAETKEARDEIIKRSYIFDLLFKMIELKGFAIGNEEVAEEYYSDYCLTSDFDEYDFRVFYSKYQIFEYLKEEKIID